MTTNFGEFLPRRGGKTLKAVQWARQNDGLIVCHSQREANRLLSEYLVTAVCYTSVRRLRGARRPFIVENAELIPIHERAELFRDRNFVGSSWSPT